MSLSKYVSTRETANFARLVMIILGPCTDVLRDVLRKQIKPDVLSKRVKQSIAKKKKLPITKQQEQLVYTCNYSKFDITLLYLLLRNVSGIRPHSTHWGNEPSPGDNSVSANIERIREIRNKYYGHANTCSLSDFDFEQKCKTIHQIVKKLEDYLGTSTIHQNELSNLKCCSLDPNVEKSYIEIVLKFDKLQEDVEFLETQNHGLQGRVDVLEKTSVPLHVKVKCDMKISKWKDHEKVFLETHNFAAMLKKVRNQPYVTFVGAPGSGKTATARHIALKLQQEGYQCLPITETCKIEEYSDPINPQVFVIDDVVGFMGFDLNSFFTLERYKETLINPLMPKTKVLMTCREIVYRSKQALNTFLTKEENVVLLQSTENALNENDKRELLSRYQLGNDFLCKADLGSTSNMFPLLCKLYITEDEFSGYGPSFFTSPVPCILKALDEMKTRSKIHYASLVLLMAWQGPLSIDLLKDSESSEKEDFERKKCEFLKACEVSSLKENSEFVDALSEMEGAYTVKNDQQINFIHDSMFEIIAYHFGRHFPEVILENLNNKYIANYIKIDTSSSRKRKRYSEEETDQTVEDRDSVTKHNYVNDLCIKLKESQCPMLAKYWYNDLGAGDLFSAFGNVSLKHPYVFQPFIRMIEDEPYFMFHSLFLENLEIENIIFPTVLDSLEKNFEPSDAHALLTGCMLINKKVVFSVKAISFVIYYGHHQILECIIDRVIREKGSLHDLFENEYTKSSRLHYDFVLDSDADESDRDVDGDDYYPKTVIDRGNESDFDADANASADTNSAMDDNEDCEDPDSNTDVTDSDCDTDRDSETAIYWKPVSIEQIRLLCLGCHSGDLFTVQILLRHVNKNALNITDNVYKANNPLAIAIKLGHLKIAMELLKIWADVNSNIFDYSPLIGACKYGHISIVEELIKNGTDVNLKCKGLDRGCITPLIIACQRGQLRVVEELIKLGADVNLAGKETPLTAACLNGHLDIVEILLKKGADINLVNGEKKTPHEVARERGHEDVLKTLTEVLIYSRV